MVLERLYDTEYLYTHKLTVLFLSIAFTVFAIAASLLLFGEFGPSLVAVALTALFLLAALHGVFTRIEGPHGSLAGLLSRFREFIALFTYVFLGVFLTFSVFSLLMPHYAITHLFTSQQGLIAERTANSLFIYGTVPSVFVNNLVVFLVCFIISFLFGIGTAFLLILVWNASVIGVVFGAVAQQSGINTLFVFVVLVFGALPHIAFEILAYLIAGVAGESLSFYTLQDRWERVTATIPLVFSALLAGLVFLVIAALFERFFAQWFINIFV